MGWSLHFYKVDVANWIWLSKQTLLTKWEVYTSWNYPQFPYKNNTNNSKQIHVEAILNKVFEGINITVVCEFVVVGRKLLQALNHDTHDIACWIYVICKHHNAPCHKIVYHKPWTQVPLANNYCSKWLRNPNHRRKTKRTACI